MTHFLAYLAQTSYFLAGLGKTFCGPMFQGQKANPFFTVGKEGAWHNNSLTMTYFPTGICTIIGAKSFHGPVRDGKGWDRLAMVVRHNGLLS